MCLTSPSRFRAVAVQAQVARYRRYTEAKAKISKDLPPDKYAEEVRRLAKKYKI